MVAHKLSLHDNVFSTQCWYLSNGYLSAGCATVFDLHLRCYFEIGSLVQGEQGNGRALIVMFQTLDWELVHEFYSVNTDTGAFVMSPANFCSPHQGDRGIDCL